MSYYDSAKGVRISQARALVELKRHGLDDAESVSVFFKECGKRKSYRAQAVLDWLGY